MLSQERVIVEAPQIKKMEVQCRKKQQHKLVQIKKKQLCQANKLALTLTKDDGLKLTWVKKGKKDLKRAVKLMNLLPPPKMLPP